MDQGKIIVGITQGDVNGVGYEVILKTLMDNRIYEMCTPIVYGSPKIAAYHRKALNIENFSLNIISKASEVNHKRANIINCNHDGVRVELGKSTEIAGQAAYEALERAVNDLKSGVIDVLVTAPINKHNIQSEEFGFPGHTEYLESKFSGSKSLMLMISDVMKVGVVAGHVPIVKVPEYITKDRIFQKLKSLNQSLIEDFNIRKPKIAVFGLNPHAGDNGLLGKEEEEIIIPAIEMAKNDGIIAIGPYPADGFFGSNNFKKFDAILAMFHDQGLAPFKALSFSDGINFTAGLPVIRTSPSHGTAFEIAGLNEASENSFRQSLYLGIDAYKNRLSFAELNANPLKSKKDALISAENNDDNDILKLKEEEDSK
jgi:4-hydroxythreonine-4-phosphate dehydrogenase